MSLSYENFLTWQSPGLGKSGLCFMFFNMKKRLRLYGHSLFLKLFVLRNSQEHDLIKKCNPYYYNNVI